MRLSRRNFLKGAGVAAGAAALSYLGFQILKGAGGNVSQTAFRRSRQRDRVILIGIDGLDPGLLEILIQEGAASNFERLRRMGAGGRLQTVLPPQSPVAWCTLASGSNPGKHGVFDFIHRDPKRLLPFLSICQTETGISQSKYATPRRNAAFWNTLSDQDVPVQVLRWPVTFPPEKVTGRMLAGLGVPSLQDTLGYYTVYTSAPEGKPGAPPERFVKVQMRGQRIETDIKGPKVRGLIGTSEATVPLRIEWNGPGVTLRAGERPITLKPREWSDWVSIKFPVGAWKKASAIVKFYLLEREPVFSLYMTAPEPDPASPPFPVSSPEAYSAELAKSIGTYHTLGMPEDTKALGDGVLSPEAFLEQCAEVTNERLLMFWHEFERFEEGLLACVFDTSDRIQHNFWGENVLDKDYRPERLGRAIRDHYLAMDRFVGEVLDRIGDKTALMVFSDHGFTSFETAFDLNAWLHAEGFMALTEDPANRQEDDTALYRLVDWSRTKAYGCGFSSLYLNLRGRERDGIIDPADGKALAREIAVRLADYGDPRTGQKPVHRVYLRDETYHGGQSASAPELIVGFRPGYRMSWHTAIGGVSPEITRRNEKCWNGDHIVDPIFVPGTILTNLPLDVSGATAADIAPTALSLLGVAPDPDSDGKPLRFPTV